MSGLPSGTVTFLFTDIEGSTRLLRQLGERYVEVVGRHDRLVRAACAGHGGREVNTQGDAFFVAFARAGDAVAAAVRVQRALAAERWPEGTDVRVRMGLHTGEPVVGGSNYVGLAVHRAARICAVGHGGQILLSSATRELLEDDLKPEISFRDLGDWRLKDFDRPEHLFQLVAAGLAVEFPPPVSIAVRPRPADAVELPPALDAGTPLAGREADLDALREQWRCAHGGTGRLVLVAGGRGLGKTRLAAELAGEVHRDRGAVLYASGAGAPETTLELLASARVARRPTLLVVDDVDRAGKEVWTALGEVVGALAELPVLVVATAEDAGLVTGLRADTTLVLAPLDADGVRAVVRLYAAEREDAEMPIERLAETSGGVPLRVHRAAGDWARTLVVRRLADTAGRISAERPVLRAAEDDLAGNILELQTARTRAEPLAAGTEGVVVCPFKGLASFDVDDAEVFFGRERLVAEMVARLTGAPLMGIVGPSGSGKSSVLRAGLLAALAAGVLPGSERWTLALLRPGEQPMQALEQATADVASPRRLVIAVDQFEEVFTACRDASERSAFVGALVGSALDPRRRAVVLIAVRADFYGRCAAYPELSRLLGANHVLVGSMGRDELRRAIELPARRASLRVEPELVDALIADVEREPGALPLLSASLLELWQRHDGRTLRLSAYEDAGGVHGAVGRLAETAYERLMPAQRDVARLVLLRLAGEGEGDAVVRRRVPLTELQGERDEGVAEVLAVLAEDRLVTIGEGEAEVAHEALLREWPRLRGWLEEDAEGRHLHLHLGAAAREWDAGGRDPSELYRGARLASAQEWHNQHEQDLNQTERAFLDASRTAEQSELDAAHRRARRLGALALGLAALVLLAGFSAFLAIRQTGRTEAARRAAISRSLANQALSQLEQDPSLGALLSLEAYRVDSTLEARSAVLTALQRFVSGARVIHAHTGAPRTGDAPSVAFSPDGKRLASAGFDGNVRLWDVGTRRPLGNPLRNDTDLVPGVAFSPDGKTLASAGFDGMVRLWDVGTHRPLGEPLRGNTDRATSVAFSPDGKTLASAGFDGMVRLWDVGTHRPLGQPLKGHIDFVASVAFSPDGKTLASTGADGTVRLWDVGTRRPLGQPLRGHTGLIYGVAFSPDGKTLASAGAEGTVRLWDVGMRRSVGQPLEGHNGDVFSVAFSADGKTLASAGADRTVRLWDVDTRRPLGQPLRGHTDFVGRVAFSPDGKTLASAGADRTVRLWDPILWNHSWRAFQRRVCAAVIRPSLSRAEWRQFLPGEPYRDTCRRG